MAISSSFQFTNTTEFPASTKRYDIGVTTNYALMSDSNDVVMLNNKTAPIDAEEIITYRSRNIKKVDTNLNIQYPAKNLDGIQYQVMVEDVLSTTDSADPNFRIDVPIVAQLTIRHPKFGQITNEHVATVFKRLMSACIKGEAAGSPTYRFEDLMRSAERPTVD